MNTQKPSLIKTLARQLNFLVFITAVIAGSKILWDEYSSFKRITNKIRDQQLADTKEKLEHHVHHIASHIEQLASTEEQKLKDTLKQRVNEFHAQATHLYNLHKRNKSRTEIERLIIEAARPIRFLNNRGYYFAGDLLGNVKLNAGAPDWEGRNTKNNKSSDGKYPVQEFIMICKTKGEGFFQYNWKKPSTKGNQHKKLAFVKHFKPFNWFLGTGEYLEDFKAQLQESAIKIVETSQQNSLAKNIIGDFAGLAISGPAPKGTNVLGLTDENGIKIVEELIALAKKGGGYLRYVLPAVGDAVAGDKISYVLGIKKWNWYVSAGKSVANIEALIRKEKKEATSGAIINTLLIVFSIFLVHLIISFTIRRLAKYIDDNISHFNTFLKDAVEKESKIDLSKIEHEEFEDLAISANKMIGELGESKKEINKLIKDISQHNEELGSILRITYHDLRTPLVNIDGFGRELESSIHSIISTLEKENLSPETRKIVNEVNDSEISVSLKYIESNIRQINLLIHGLQRVSHLGRIVAFNEDTDVNKITDDILTASTQQIEKHNITINKENLDHCSADHTLLPMVLTNIIENAIKYRSDDRNSEITLSSTIVGDNVSYNIVDNGIGIEEEHKNKVFEIFYRRHPNADIIGEGLGLTLAKQLMVKQQGSISINPNKNHGVTVTLNLKRSN